MICRLFGEFTATLALMLHCQWPASADAAPIKFDFADKVTMNNFEMQRLNPSVRS
jgi:hypothetical protein